MIIYRVENEEGKGPYHANLPGISYLSYDHRPPSYTLEKWDVLEYDNMRKYHFGFPNLKALKEWFEEDFNRLAKHGFWVNKYKGKGNVFDKTDKQLVFNKEKSILLETITIEYVEEKLS